MPIIQLHTNVKVDDAQGLVLELSKLCAETLGRPEMYVTVEFMHTEYLAFAGTFEPAFFMAVYSLDNFSPEKNIGYSMAFSDFLEKKLGIPNTRGYIGFVDNGAQNVGYMGTTLVGLMAAEKEKNKEKTK